MKTKIVWEDPPVRRIGPIGGNGKGDWQARLLPLVEHPGRWARVAEFPHLKNGGACLTQLNRRVYAVPPGRWEFASRTTGYVGTRIYARYLGPEVSV